jgi:hypothetical protein
MALLQRELPLQLYNAELDLAEALHALNACHPQNKQWQDAATELAMTVNNMISFVRGHGDDFQTSDDFCVSLYEQVNRTNAHLETLRNLCKNSVVSTPEHSSSLQRVLKATQAFNHLNLQTYIVVLNNPPRNDPPSPQRI